MLCGRNRDEMCFVSAEKLMLYTKQHIYCVISAVEVYVMQLSHNTTTKLVTLNEYLPIEDENLNQPIRSPYKGLLKGQVCRLK